MGLSRAQTRERVEAIIDFAGIGDHIEQPIKHYSSGMVVRLGFAVASALDPEVLITDEVLAVGDESFQKKCIRWLERFRAGGGTLLLVSHSMFHIQTLCSRAMWLDQGRVRQVGDSFDVTREYLTFHEENSRREQLSATAVSGDTPRIVESWIDGAADGVAPAFAIGEELALEGVAHGPDGRPPVVLFGIVRADGTPVFGTHSNDAGFVPRSDGGRRFSFRLRLPALNLLPGKYTVRLHAMDPEGLRLFDTVEMPFVVTGRTRDYGFVRLEHQWSDGGRNRTGA